MGILYLEDLEIDVDSNTLWLKNYESNKTDSIPPKGLMQNTIASQVHTLLGKLALPLFEGSNSWVIDPEKTKNGAVLFSNDPHIGFAQPAVWYEAHISTPHFKKYGYYIGGVTFPLLAHNRKLAYGLTMFENDDVDFYYEETNPKDSTQYKTPKGWEPYIFVTKSIPVKGEEDVAFTYKKTKHGPVLNGIANQITGERPISMSWTYTSQENKLFSALYTMAHAEGLEEFKSALPNIHAPGLNVMYGDAKGNVAWFASAKLHTLPDSVHSKMILDGASGREERVGYLDFSKNPKAINPPWKYVYSANNQPDSVDGRLYPGYYLPENRAKRITKFLDSKNDWDTESMQKMITDITSEVNPLVLKYFSKVIYVNNLNINKIELLDGLRLWHGNYPLDSYAATVYHRWVYYYLKNTFADELGDEMFNQFWEHIFLKE